MAGSRGPTSHRWPPIQLPSDKPNKFLLPAPSPHPLSLSTPLTMNTPAGYIHGHQIFWCVCVQVGQPCATIKGNYPLCWWSDLRYDERFKSNPDNFLKSVFLSSSDALLDCHRFVLNYAIVMATLVDTGCMVTPSTCVWLLYFLLQHPRETERKQSV